jgi:hypothetical protein
MPSTRQASPVARIPDTDPSAGRAAALSIDNLAVGFELSALHVSLVFTAIVIGVVSTGSCAASAGSRRKGPRVRGEPLDYRRPLRDGPVAIAPRARVRHVPANARAGWCRKQRNVSVRRPCGGTVLCRLAIYQCEHDFDLATARRCRRRLICHRVPGRTGRTEGR